MEPTSFQTFAETNPWFLPLIIVLALWDGVWKMIAMWRAARNNSAGWFIALAVLNTVGVLPIYYVLTHKNKE